MPTSQKSAVITGASSGIGWSCVERMSRAGWQVFAGVRKEADRENLRKDFAANVCPVLIDVENEAFISAAAADIERQLSGRGLDGLVNVAGIGMLRPIEFARCWTCEKYSTSISLARSQSSKLFRACCGGAWCCCCRGS